MIHVLETIAACIVIVGVVLATGLLLALVVTILPASWAPDDDYPDDR